MFSSRARFAFFAAALTLGTLILYGMCVGFSFLRLDDPDYTFACAFVKDGFTCAGVREAVTNLRHGGIWMPLTYLSYMADISLFGPSPAGHHLTSVLLHAVNAVLLFRLLTLLMPERENFAWPLAFAAALFWMVHPQRVEAVAWVASRKELLWTAFALAGLTAWVKERRGLATVFAALACLSKPTAMVFPFLALVLDLLLEREIRWKRFLPLLALAVATGLVALYSQTHPEGFAVQAVYTASFGHRLLNAVCAIGLYGRQLLMPAALHLDYRFLAEEMMIALAFFAAFVVCVIFALRTVARRPVGAALLWFAAAVGPTLGLFASFGEQSRADRFIYLASMAVPLALVVLLRSPRARRIGAGFLVLESLIFSGVTVSLARTYRNDTAAFTRTILCDPENGRALAHLGEAECAAGKMDEGIADLEHSLVVRPVPETLGKLTYALMRRGRADDFREIEDLSVALVQDPSSDRKGQALEALGTARLHAHDWKNAAEYLYLSVTAPARFYSAEDAKFKLAIAWYNAGRREDAKKLFDQLATSTRADLAERAKNFLIAVYEDPDILLFL